MDTQELITFVTVTRPALLVQILHQAKPYLKEIEDEVKAVGYGKLSVDIVIRAGEVEKMDIRKTKTWLRQKPTIDGKPGV